jgi:hypothetical protein
MIQAEIAGAAEIDAPDRVESHQAQHQRIAWCRIESHCRGSEKRATVAFDIDVEHTRFAAAAFCAVHAVSKQGSSDEAPLKSVPPGEAVDPCAWLDATG